MGSLGFDNGMLSSTAMMLRAVSDFFCLKSETGTYCITLLPKMQSVMGGTVNIGSGSPSTNMPEASTYCPMLTNAGCCMSATLNFVGSITSLTDGPTINPATLMPQLNKIAKENCNGLVLPSTCTPDAANSAKLNGIAKLSLLWSWWNAQTQAKQQLIKTALCTDLAATGAFMADQCSVTGVSQNGGSRRLLADTTSFDYQVLGVSKEALQSSATSLNGNVDYSDVSAAADTPVTGTSSVQSVQGVGAGVKLAGNLLTVGVIAVIAALAL